ncbi:hypothetical protein D3C73_1544580 [compost metagenome]
MYSSSSRMSHTYSSQARRTGRTVSRSEGPEGEVCSNCKPFGSSQYRGRRVSTHSIALKSRIGKPYFFIPEKKNRPRSPRLS